MQVTAVWDISDVDASAVTTCQYSMMVAAMQNLTLNQAGQE